MLTYHVLVNIIFTYRNILFLYGGNMPIQQLSLFEEKVKKESSKTTKKRPKPRNADVSIKVTTYRISDRKTDRSYIGVSMEPDVRFATHKKGFLSNKELNDLMSSRPNDVVYEKIEEFDDPFYRANIKESRAIKIEAFLIQYYNTIEHGMNTTLIFHHDYFDTDFWKEILTQKMYENYIMADKSLLNQRSLKHCTVKKNTRQNKRPVHKEGKIWIIEYLKELDSLEIKVAVLAKKIGNIDRVNLFKLMNQEDYGSVSFKKLLNFVRKLEKHLSIPQRDLPNYLIELQNED